MFQKPAASKAAQAHSTVTRISPKVAEVWGALCFYFIFHSFHVFCGFNCEFYMIPFFLLSNKSAILFLKLFLVAALEYEIYIYS